MKIKIGIPYTDNQNVKRQSCWVKDNERNWKFFIREIKKILEVQND